MKRLKVLHVYQSPSYSGAEAYALEVAYAQSSSHDVTFLARENSPLLAKLAGLKSSMTISFAINTVPLDTFDIIVLHSTQELRSHWLRLAFAKFRAELLRRPAPIVALYTHIWISHSKRDPIHAIPYSVVDQVWCASLKAREALVKYLPVSDTKIKIVRYGRDIQRLANDALSRADARRKLDIPPEALVIGTLARVDKGKGSRELFEAVTDLMQSRADVHLLMMGPPTDGDPAAATLDAELNSEVEKLTPAIRLRVHKMGRVENGTRLLAAFDLFVLATYKENFALTLLEALAAEVPCLATDSGGSPDVVRPHATGWLFLPESAPSLHSTLMTAIDQRAKWSEFGANGRKLVQEGYDFNRVMQGLEQRMLALVNRRPPVEPSLD